MTCRLHKDKTYILTVAMFFPKGKLLFSLSTYQHYNLLGTKRNIQDLFNVSNIYNRCSIFIDIR